LVGLDLVLDTNIAPSVRMKNNHPGPDGFEPGKVNLMQASLGLALSFRR
jgi:hypothetical protein